LAGGEQAVGVELEELIRLLCDRVDRRGEIVGLGEISLRSCEKILYVSGLECVN
jgi:hypothetical protein